jgi:hypothetical protein
LRGAKCHPSDADDDGHTLAVGMHAAFVAAY